MFIVYSYSRSTHIAMYYNGYVEITENGRAKVQSSWTNIEDFATQFATFDLAQRIADAFSAQNHANIEFHTKEI